MCDQKCPDAKATLSEYDGVYIWTVHCCPLCGDKHVHGGGRVGENNPYDFLAHRVAHCLNLGPGNHGYVLVADDDRLDPG